MEDSECEAGCNQMSIHRNLGRRCNNEPCWEETSGLASLERDALIGVPQLGSTLRSIRRRDGNWEE